MKGCPETPFKRQPLLNVLGCDVQQSCPGAVSAFNTADYLLSYCFANQITDGPEGSVLHVADAMLT